MPPTTVPSGSVENSAPQIGSSPKIPLQYARRAAERRTATMTEYPNVALVRRFYEACNRGDQDLLRVCLAPDVVRYFAGRNPAAGAEKLIAYCLASVAQLQSHWSIDHALAGGGEAG